MRTVKKLLLNNEKADSEEIMYGITDIGRNRRQNEDYFLVSPEKELLIAADGMGGHNAGDVASRMTVEFLDASLSLSVLKDIRSKPVLIKETLLNLMSEANRKIIHTAKENPAYHGMGCTIVVGLIDNNTLHVCNVGDARAYVSDEKRMHLLTTDHSTVMKLVRDGRLTMEEARHSDKRSELYQAIGAPSTIIPDYNQYPLQDNDKILLCSDGLWDMLSDVEIFYILKQKHLPKALCEELVERANEAGGADNITALVAIHHSKPE